MNQRYHTGFNQVDFMPTTEPTCFEAWSDAAVSLMDEMREYADQDDDAAIEAGDESPAMLATVDSILADDPPRAEQDYTAIVEDNSYRRYAFWLLKVTCECYDTIEAGDA